MDPPDYTRMRKLANKGFTPRLIRAMEPRVRTITQDHVAFGYGIYYCLGAPLARLEGRSAVEALLFDCPPFTRVLAQVPRIAAFLVRGPKTLPLRFATARTTVA